MELSSTNNWLPPLDLGVEQPVGTTKAEGVRRWLWVLLGVLVAAVYLCVSQSRIHTLRERYDRVTRLYAEGQLYGPPSSSPSLYAVV